MDGVLWQRADGVVSSSSSSSVGPAVAANASGGILWQHSGADEGATTAAATAAAGIPAAWQLGGPAGQELPPPPQLLQQQQQQGGQQSPGRDRGFNQPLPWSSLSAAAPLPQQQEQQEQRRWAQQWQPGLLSNVEDDGMMAVPQTTATAMPAPTPPAWAVQQPQPQQQQRQQQSPPPPQPHDLWPAIVAASQGAAVTVRWPRAVADPWGTVPSGLAAAPDDLAALALLPQGAAAVLAPAAGAAVGDLWAREGRAVAVGSGSTPGTSAAAAGAR